MRGKLREIHAEDSTHVVLNPNMLPPRVSSSSLGIPNNFQNVSATNESVEPHWPSVCSIEYRCEASSAKYKPKTLLTSS